MKRKLRYIIPLGIVLVFGAMQLVPTEARTNPQIVSDISAPPEVKSILMRACYDCHSYETNWPWYSRVAPVSWLVVRDVNEARDELNFSAWSGYDPEEQAHLITEIWENVEEGEMPLKMYKPLHPEARLTSADLEVLQSWAATNGEVE
jgi:hypothetical protein